MSHPAWTPAELLNMSGSYWLSSALHAGVKLDIFTPLSAAALSAAALAERLNCSERGLTMLLDALAAMELLEKESELYRSSPFAAECLASSSAGYLGHIIRHHHHLMGSWLQLDESVRSGQPVRNRLSHEGEAVERESFLLGMFNLALQQAPAIAERIDLGGRTRLLDLGGGPGTYAVYFCRRNPALRATIFDLPTTRDFAEQTVRRFGLQDRIDFLAGDFQQDPVRGGYDVAWLSHVLHGEGAAGCAALLDKTVAALEPGGRLLIQEFILDDRRDRPLFPALFSLNMLLVTPHGQAYSESELRTMLAAAGLEQIERLPIELPNGAGIMSGRKADQP